MGATKKIVLACEDAQQSSFISECLRKLSAKKLKRDLYPWIAAREEPNGNVDSVIKHVKDVEFPAWQSRCPSCATLLVVVADADTKSIPDRVSCFPSRENSLLSNLYVIIVPKRNIETWVVLSNGTGVDEITDYKNAKTTASDVAKNAASQLMEWFLHANRLPSSLANHPVWRTFHDAMECLKTGLHRIYN